MSDFLPLLLLFTCHSALYGCSTRQPHVSILAALLVAHLGSVPKQYLQSPAPSGHPSYCPSPEPHPIEYPPLLQLLVPLTRSRSDYLCRSPSRLHLPPHGPPTHS